MLSSKRPAGNLLSARRSRLVALILRLGVGLLAGSHLGFAGAADPNLEHPTHLVTVARDGYSIAGIATHLEGASTLRTRMSSPSQWRRERIRKLPTMA